MTSLAERVEPLLLCVPYAPGLDDRLPDAQVVAARPSGPSTRPGRPYALFGHGPGAPAALELARSLRDSPPSTLVVSGCPAPPPPDDQLDCRLVVLAELTEPSDLEAAERWRSHTQGSFAVRPVPAGIDGLADALAAELAVVAERTAAT